jgi:hypothetical protein
VINGSGEPVVGDFWKIVESEHCRSPDSSEPFLTSNYGITTTPAQEWEITTKQNASLADMRHDRRLPNPEELLQSDLSKRAGLTLIEVIVLVLYTGPMVGYRARVPPPSAPAPASLRVFAAPCPSPPGRIQARFSSTAFPAPLRCVFP